jgi:SPP1 gp7 family putative phage head morphogenesis protein
MDEQEIRAIVAAAVAEEVVSILRDMGITPERALIDYLTGSLTEAAIQANPALYEAIRSSLTLPISDVALNEARTMAARQSATLVTGELRQQVRQIGDVIARGLQEGKGPREIARMLDMVDSLTTQQAKRLEKFAKDLQNMGLTDEQIKAKTERMRQSLLKERKENIARTETRYAIEEAQKTQAKAAGKNWKQWITVGDDRVSDICRGNEAQGWIAIDDLFKSGAGQPPGHVNCRCTVAYRAELNRLAEWRAQRRIDKTAAANGDTDDDNE